MTLQQQLKEVQREHPQAHIRYNANTGVEFICYFSEKYYSSLFIIKK